MIRNFKKRVSYRKNGLTWQQFADATAGSTTVAHDLFRLYEGIPTSAIETGSDKILIPKEKEIALAV